MALRIHRMFRAKEQGSKGTFTWCKTDEGEDHFIWNPDSGGREDMRTSSFEEPRAPDDVKLGGRWWRFYKELPVTAPKVTTTAVSLPVRPQARPAKGRSSG